MEAEGAAIRPRKQKKPSLDRIKIVYLPFRLFPLFP